SPIFK
ncbi:hypothetical protein MK338_04090, partial [Streptococcus vestibularis]